MVYAYGPTSLDILRAHGRLLPDLLASPRARTLKGPSLLAPNLLAELMARAGAKTPPFHVMTVNKNNPWRDRKDIVVHSRTAPLPYRSLIPVNKELTIASPELAFIQLAAMDSYDEIDLARIAYELCGTYVLDVSWDGFTNTEAPITNKGKMLRMIERESRTRGAAKAKRALECIYEKSNSPMKSDLALLFAAPRRIGGFDLGPIAMNYKVKTKDGAKYVDLFFLERNVGLEYKGKDSHSIEKTQRDDRRQNRLVAEGVTIINVWYDDLVNDQLFDKLARDVFAALNARLRCRSKRFQTQQKLLRAKLLPSIQKFGSFEP